MQLVFSCTPCKFPQMFLHPVRLSSLFLQPHQESCSDVDHMPMQPNIVEKQINIGPQFLSGLISAVQWQIIGINLFITDSKVVSLATHVQASLQFSIISELDVDSLVQTDSH